MLDKGSLYCQNIAFQCGFNSIVVHLLLVYPLLELCSHVYRKLKVYIWKVAMKYMKIFLIITSFLKIIQILEQKKICRFFAVLKTQKPNT